MPADTPSPWRYSFLNNVKTGVPDVELEHLIDWPPGTRGYVSEQAAIRQLNDLCWRLGYGRVFELATQINAVRNDGDDARLIQLDAAASRHEMVASSMRTCLAHPPAPAGITPERVADQEALAASLRTRATALRAIRPTGDDQ